MTNAFVLFQTAVGRCGIAWKDASISAIQLPDQNDATTIARLKRLSGAKRSARPPAFVAHAVDAIINHLAGDPADLDAIDLDFAGLTAFERSIYLATRAIPSGHTRTYGEIAADLGDPKLARAVGAALGRNPWPIVVPCHRVLAANRKLGGFSASGGRNTKLRLLGIERAILPGSDLFGQASIG